MYPELQDKFTLSDTIFALLVALDRALLKDCGPAGALLQRWMMDADACVSENENDAWIWLRTELFAPSEDRKEIRR